MCAWVWVWGRPRTGRVPSAGTQEIHPSPAPKDPMGEMCAGENTQHTAGPKLPFEEL